MTRLNLTATGKEQTLIKEYLEENASDMLADKINNGVKLEKDNKMLLNKKDLNGFMRFANDEARKQSEKGANCACIEDKVVFGWAIHYFEEDCIEGTLFHEDGTEFKAAAKVIAAPKAITKVPVKQEKKQASLFDFLDEPTNEIEESDDTDEVEEAEQDNEEDETESLSYKGQIAKHSQPDLIEEQEHEEDFTEDEIVEVMSHETMKEQPIQDGRMVDLETGELLMPRTSERSSIDKEFAIILYNLLDGKLEVK